MAFLSELSSPSSSVQSELMYGLRFVERNNRGDPRRVYSLRQMAVCHKEEPDCKLTTMVFVSPPTSIVQSISDQLGNQETAASNKPFDVHLLFFNFAVSSWRPYLVHLAQELHQHVGFVTYGISIAELTQTRPTQYFWLRQLELDLSVSMGVVMHKD